MTRINSPLDVRMEVPQHLKKFLKNPTPAMKNARKMADKRSLFFLREEISEEAPRKRGDLANSIEVNLEKNNVYTMIAHARAVELGHFAEAKEGKYLRFSGASQRTGTWVFPTNRYKNTQAWGSFIRTEKQPFFFPTLSKNRLRLIDIYENEHAKMLKKIGRKL